MVKSSFSLILILAVLLFVSGCTDGRQQTIDGDTRVITEAYISKSGLTGGIIYFTCPVTAGFKCGLSKAWFISHKPFVVGDTVVVQVVKKKEDFNALFYNQLENNSTP